VVISGLGSPVGPVALPEVVVPAEKLEVVERCRSAFGQRDFVIDMDNNFGGTSPAVLTLALIAS
jgi:hypothetical protein